MDKRPKCKNNEACLNPINVIVNIIVSSLKNNCFINTNLNAINHNNNPNDSTMKVNMNQNMKPQ